MASVTASFSFLGVSGSLPRRCTAPAAHRPRRPRQPPVRRRHLVVPPAAPAAQKVATCGIFVSTPLQHGVADGTFDPDAVRSCKERSHEM